MVVMELRCSEYQLLLVMHTLKFYVSCNQLHTVVACTCKQPNLLHAPLSNDNSSQLKDGLYIVYTVQTMMYVVFTHVPNNFVVKKVTGLSNSSLDCQQGGLV